MIAAAAVALAVLATSASARQMTVKNNCDFTVWPAIFTDPSSGDSPDHATGWEAAAGSTEQFEVPDNWTAGRIWGRTGCDFSSTQDQTSCATGGCNGGLECATEGGTGVPPVTVAEWTLIPDGEDNYDVSLVDGYNIPVSVKPTQDCPEASCPKELNADCPAELQKKDGDGKVVGCYTACSANLDGDASNSPNCCSGDFDKPETCPSSGVQYYDYFKDGCPNSYAYAYDESSGTALWTCTGSKNADYTVTFCP
ncbi:thaumatin [Schizophyllum commune]